MKVYKDERINTILSNLEFDMKKDEEYNYRDVDSDLKEVCNSIDNVLDYVDNGYKGKLYLNSNIWQVCYEALVHVLNLYDLKFIGSEKVTEREEIITVNEYIEKELQRFDLYSETSNKEIENYYFTLKEYKPDIKMTNLQKREHLYKYLLDNMQKKGKITEEQRQKYEKEFLGKLLSKKQKNKANER